MVRIEALCDGLEQPAERERVGREAEEKLLSVGRDEVRALRRSVGLAPPVRRRGKKAEE